MSEQPYPTLRSQLDRKSDDYRKNHDAGAAAVAKLTAALREATVGGGDKYNSRHLAAGKLLPRQRVELLLDRDSYFLELCPLAGKDVPGHAPGASVVGGIGLVSGTECLITASEATVKGGAMSEMSVWKSGRLSDVAAANRLPSISLIESAGADLPNQSKIFVPGGRGFRDLTRRSEERIPTICLVFGSSTAGGAYIPGMSDYVVMVKEQAQVYLAGPPLVKMATGEESGHEELGGAEMHARVSGVSDYLAADEHDAIRLGREIVAHLNWRKAAAPLPRAVEPPRYDPEELLGVVPADPRTPYDCREVIARVVDGSRFSEFKPLYGSTLVCGWAHVHGYPVGILANNGILFSESSQKGAQFIELCNQIDVPLVFLQNITGFMVGKKYEQEGIIKHGAKLINAVSNSTVPAITIMTGASFGAGNYAMSGRAYAPRFLFTWPSHRIAVMGGKQLAGVLDIIQREAAAKRGETVDEQKLAFGKAMIEGQIDKESDPYFATARLWDDGIIDPRDTRTVVAIALSAAYTAPVHGTTSWGSSVTEAPHRYARPCFPGSGAHPIRETLSWVPAPTTTRDWFVPSMSHHPPAHPVSRPIRRVLVANRGEIAARVLRTCRHMGLGTVAVYSDADVAAPHVRLADVAVPLGAAPARDSYLAIDKLLAAARATGADAIHPGYGFLSENAAFAEAVTAAGLTFIGPSAMVIALLGSKKAAKARAIAAGVPVVPGYNGDDQDLATLADRARAVGFPLLVKASAGGGGKGMRIVRDGGEVRAALEAAQREAASAFGDDTLILERYVERPRHVEIQILGDHHGTLVHLWERECSIQRRHQKVIEEAPSPALTPELRATMGAAGVAVGRAVGYTSAGTVEFIVAPDGSYYFLEVNTRLQVEHPVTEATTGLDLVREQIRIARGERLGYDAAPPQRGHAIEVRLYAEDPANGYLPTIGTLARFDVPSAPGLRVDAGVETGTEIGIHYDPMLAKVIAHAPTRTEAADLLAWALERAVVAGVVTNRDHLARILRLPAFLAGELDTHFLERHRDALRTTDDGAVARAVVAATLWTHEQARDRGPLPQVRAGWRNVWFAPQRDTWRVGDREVVVAYRHRGDGGFTVEVDGVASEVRVIEASAAAIAWHSGDVTHRAQVIATAAGWSVFGPGWAADVVRLPRLPDRTTAIAPGSLIAPMPGKVIKVGAVVGDTVAEGAVLVVLEAMKMEQPVKVAVTGTVTALSVAVGDQVAAEQLLAIVTPGP